MEENTVTKEETFEYTYSAKRQEEINKIKSKYMPEKETEDKMAQLRALDASVTRPGTIWGIVVGVIGTLIMGGGMSCVMVGAESLFVPGIVLGLVGIAVMAVAYPLYVKMTKKQKEKLAPQILALAEELSK